MAHTVGVGGREVSGGGRGVMLFALLWRIAYENMWLRYVICDSPLSEYTHCTKKFSIKFFFSKWANPQETSDSFRFTKKSLMKNFLFCAVTAYNEFAV